MADLLSVKSWYANTGVEMSVVHNGERKASAEKYIGDAYGIPDAASGNPCSKNFHS